ncbi:SLC13 family permease [Saccharopolyspora sp. NPDC050389]|uniref:SLC13 family permease n=1 Tax=Saccharopolyspora sp. NPDC050389 TaxID=3155516 RepID=UPI0033E05032
MASQVLALLVLAVAFLIATVRPVHMGVLALAAALGVGTTLGGASLDDVLSGFPVDIMLLLLGVTYLFGIARSNGALDWMIDRLVRATGDRVALLPALFFALSLAVASFGSPLAAVVLIPIGLSFAGRNGLSPVVMGLAMATGGSAGSFAPISLFGLITTSIAGRSGIEVNPLLLFGAAIGINVVLFAAGSVLFRRALVAEAAPEEPTEVAPGSGGGAGETALLTKTGTAARLSVFQRLTIVMLALLVVFVVVLTAVGVEVNVGAVALGLGVVLSLCFTKETAQAVKEIDWSTILLVGGIATYVGVLDDMGAVKLVAEVGAAIPSPLLAAFILCLCGGLISAFGSTTALLAIIIPLALPLVAAGGVPAAGVICALALSSSLVDINPMSTIGATVVASGPERIRASMRKFFFRWGFSMVLVGPVVTCAFLVLPGMLA